MKITKEFRWEMGHRLPFHSSGCENVHGHSYKLIVAVMGEPNEKGMIVDYQEISDVVKPVIDQLDHSFLCQENDEAMKEFLVSENQKMVLVPFHSTAENIVKWLADQLAPIFKGRKNVSSLVLKLHETEKTSAEIKVTYMEGV